MGLLKASTNLEPCKGITLNSLPGNRTVCLHLFLRPKPHSVCCLNPLGCACRRQRALVPPPTVTRTIPSSDQRNDKNVQTRMLTSYIFIWRLWLIRSLKIVTMCICLRSVTRISVYNFYVNIYLIIRWVRKIFPDPPPLLNICYGFGRIFFGTPLNPPLRVTNFTRGNY